MLNRRVMKIRKVIIIKSVVPILPKRETKSLVDSNPTVPANI